MIVDVIILENKHVIIWGETLDLIGTTTSAIASTPNIISNETLKDSLEILGNILQATSSALIAEQTKNFSLEQYGETIQSLGNSMNVYSLLSTLDPEIQRKLMIKGELFQATGCAISLSCSLNESNRNHIYSDFLQLLGNTLQGVGEANTFKYLRSETVIMIGSWAQAIGALLSLLEQLKPDLNKTAPVINMSPYPAMNVVSLEQSY